MIGRMTVPMFTDGMEMHVEMEMEMEMDKCFELFL